MKKHQKFFILSLIFMAALALMAGCTADDPISKSVEEERKFWSGNVSTALELQQALNEGIDKITLTDDINADKITATSKFTINGNGHKINATFIIDVGKDDATFKNVSNIDQVKVQSVGSNTLTFIDSITGRIDVEKGAEGASFNFSGASWVPLIFTDASIIISVDNEGQLGKIYISNDNIEIMVNGKKMEDMKVGKNIPAIFHVAIDEDETDNIIGWPDRNFTIGGIISNVGNEDGNALIIFALLTEQGKTDFEKEKDFNDIRDKDIIAYLAKEKYYGAHADKIKEQESTGWTNNIPVDEEKYFALILSYEENNGQFETVSYDFSQAIDDVEIPGKANFEVTVEDVTVTAGKNLSYINAEIKNAGGLDDKQNIILTIDEKVLDNSEDYTATEEDLYIEAGKTEVVTFNIAENIKKDVNTYQDVITVQSDDDSDKANISVIAAEPGIVEIETNPDTVYVGEETTVAATVANGEGKIIEGVEVVFSGGSGTWGDTTVKTDKNGEAITTYRAHPDDVNGSISLIAEEQVNNNSVWNNITVKGPDSVTVKADPDTLYIGEETTVTATVTNDKGEKMEAVDVVFNGGNGTWDQTTVKTDKNGEAITTYKADADDVNGSISLIAEEQVNNNSGNADITIKGPDNVSIEADPDIFYMGEETIVTATVTNDEGKVLEGVRVKFSGGGYDWVTPFGSKYVATVRQTDENGEAKATYDIDKGDAEVVGINTLTAVEQVNNNSDDIDVTVKGPDSVNIEANPDTLFTGEETTVTATVTNDKGEKMEAVDVVFSGGSGTWGDNQSVGDPITVKTDGNGKAVTTYEAVEQDYINGNITLTATEQVNNNSDDIDITVKGPNSISVEADPETLFTGEETTVTATVTNNEGKVIKGVDVVFSGGSGTWGNNESEGDPVTLKTDENGEAVTTYEAVEQDYLNGEITLTATEQVNNNIGNVNIKVKGPHSVSIEADPDPITMGEKTTVTATVTNDEGGAIAEVDVVFSGGNGTWGDNAWEGDPITVKTDANGKAETTYEATSSDIELHEINGEIILTAEEQVNNNSGSTDLTVKGPHSIEVIYDPNEISLEEETTVTATVVNDEGEGIEDVFVEFGTVKDENVVYNMGKGSWSPEDGYTDENGEVETTYTPAEADAQEDLIALSARELKNFNTVLFYISVEE